MIVRASVIWLLLLAIAVGAGVLRTALLEPRLGEHRAHVAGTLVVVAVFTGVIWATTGWLSPARDHAALLGVGVAWLAATVVFEFGSGTT